MITSYVGHLAARDHLQERVGNRRRTPARRSAPAFPIEVFDTYWIEAGHRIREQVADDAVLAAMLRQVLKPYTGPGVVLYRGENTARWRAGTVGFAWTQERDVAEMFGAGLNAIHSGGVLLRGAFEPSAIIAGRMTTAATCRKVSTRSTPPCACL
jgi:hypothetical protein